MYSSGERCAQTPQSISKRKNLTRHVLSVPCSRGPIDRNHTQCDYARYLCL